MSEPQNNKLSNPVAAASWLNPSPSPELIQIGQKLQVCDTVAVPLQVPLQFRCISAAISTSGKSMLSHCSE
ncbi:MAG: hypothetical protein JOZ17_09270 [Acetobacteraceae bacterium]|nr:hypothetical protein [Acetobacteraceae bacterium]